MGNLSTSFKIYAGIVLILAILSATEIFLPQGNLLPTQELPASKPVMALAIFFIMLILYGGLGFLGLKLSEKLGFAAIWDSKVSNKERFFIPLLVGAGVGIFFIITDTLLSKFHTLGRIPHPPFPTSIFASVTAGIGEEIIFRLFYISFWVWLISHVILKKRWQNQIFWIFTVFSAILFAISTILFALGCLPDVIRLSDSKDPLIIEKRWQNLLFWIFTVFSAILFTVAHFPAIMALFNLKDPSAIPAPLIAELILLNGVVSIFAAYYFRKYGFLAAVGIHFWTDIVWHVVWGFIILI